MIRKAITAILCFALIGIAFVPNVEATTYFERLYDTGGPSTYTYRFLVTQNTDLVIESDTNWNFTVETQPWNAASTNQTFYLVFYINDGVINKTINTTIAAKNDQTVTSYIEFFPGDFTANDTATYYFILKNATYVQKDAEGGNVAIYQTSTGAAMADIVGIMIVALLMSIVAGVGAAAYKKRYD